MTTTTYAYMGVFDTEQDYKEWLAASEAAEAEAAEYEMSMAEEPTRNYYVLF